MSKGKHGVHEGERSTSERNTHRRHDDPAYKGKHERQEETEPKTKK